MSFKEPTVLRIGAPEHAMLKELKEDGPFAEMLHAYRLAVSLAIAHGGQTVDFSESKNLFNVGTLEDEQRSLYHAVREFRSKADEPVYRTVEKLATWGVRLLHGKLRNGDISFISLLDDLNEVSGDGS